MSNPVTPGQPYNPQGHVSSVPSAGSAPVYASYQAGSPMQAAPGVAPGAVPGGEMPGYPAAPQQPQAPAGPSFFSVLLDPVSRFAVKYGKIILVLGMVAYLGGWFFDLIQSITRLTDEYSSSYDVVHFLRELLVGGVQAVVALFILRLYVEIAAHIGGSKDQDKN